MVSQGNLYDSSSIYSSANKDNEFEKVDNIARTDKLIVLNYDSTILRNVEASHTPESFPGNPKFN